MGYDPKNLYNMNKVEGYSPVDPNPTLSGTAFGAAGNQFDEGVQNIKKGNYGQAVGNSLSSISNGVLGASMLPASGLQMLANPLKNVAKGAGYDFNSPSNSGDGVVSPGPAKNGTGASVAPVNPGQTPSNVLASPITPTQSGVDPRNSSVRYLNPGEKSSLTNSPTSLGGTFSVLGGNGSSASSGSDSTGWSSGNSSNPLDQAKYAANQEYLNRLGAYNTSDLANRLATNVANRSGSSAAVNAAAAQASQNANMLADASKPLTDVAKLPFDLMKQSQEADNQGRNNPSLQEGNFERAQKVNSVGDPLSPATQQARAIQKNQSDLGVASAQAAIPTKIGDTYGPDGITLTKRDFSGSNAAALQRMSEERAANISKTPNGELFKNPDFFKLATAYRAAKPADRPGIANTITSSFGNHPDVQSLFKTVK